MQFNPYNTVANLPRNQIGELMNVGRQSQKDVGQNLLSAVDSLRGVGVANENQLYNTKLTALQNSPEFLNANPMQRQAMIQSASSGLELDKQNLTGQEQLFKSLGQEQENLNQVARAKTADENALARLGIDINAREFARAEDSKNEMERLGIKLNADAVGADLDRVEKAEQQNALEKLRNTHALEQLRQNPYTAVSGGYMNKQTGEYTNTDSKGGSGSGKVSDVEKLTGTTKKWFNEQNPQMKDLVKSMYGTGRFNIVEIPHETADGKKLTPTSGFVVDSVTYPELESAKKALLGLGENTQKPFDANAIPSPVKKLIQEKQSQPFNWSGTNLDRTSSAVADAVRTGGYGNKIAEANAMRAKLGLPPIQ